MRKVKIFLIAGVCLALGMAGSGFAWDLTTDKVAYIVSDSHMDDCWGWTRDNTYKTLIGNVLHQNFSLLNSYPRYVFNFGGAFRFMIVEHADSVINAGGTYGNFAKGDWNQLKSFVSQGYGGSKGTWHICGKWITEPDVNIPSAESMIRHALYGGGYFEDKFGIQTSIDIHLPDCFGFGYALPTIACHTGIRGFDSHKFRLWGGAWGSAVCTHDRSIMKWYGPDSSFIYAAEIYTDHLGDPGVSTDDGNAVFNKCGVWMTYMVSGTGDQGGSNSGNRVNSLCSSPDVQIPPGSGVHAFWASSDSLWRTLVQFETTHPDIISKMSAFDGECIMTTHGTGCYTAHGDVKMRHRQCEINGLTAEPAAVIANNVAGATYPRGPLYHAWVHTLEHEFHDDLTGTSIAAAYYNSTDATCPDLDTQATTFNQIRNSSNTAVAQKLNTQVSTGSVPVVVYNPIGQDRRDPVELDVTFSSAPAAVQVINPAGQEVPSQIISKTGNTAHVLFIADVPSMGYAVYEVKPVAQATAFTTGVSAPSATTLQNNYYTVTIDGTGDISQIQDKILNKALLSQPCRWEMRNDNSTSYPAWEMQYADVSSSPREVVDQAVAAQVVENGPVRATIKVTRTRAGSTFTHMYQLYADSAGRRVVIDNTVNWNTKNTILKAGFYLSASNPNATFGLGIGTIDRPNMNNQRYEVPSQQWAALTNSDGTYGTAIMNTYKYGWSKMQNNSLHLSLVHTPSSFNEYDGDLRTHTFPYAIYGYSGNWRNGVENQTQRFNMPLVGFTTAAHTGTLGNLYSFVRPDDPTKFQIMSCKMAEKSNNVIVRVRELNGQSSNVNLFFANNITGKEVNGCEKDVASPTPVTITGNKIGFTIKRYSLRTFSVVPGNAVSVRGHAANYLPGSDVANFSVGLMGIGKRSTVKFSIANGESIRMVYVTDMRGRMMRTLFNGPSTLAGASRLDWNGKADNGKTASTGVYIVNVMTDRTVQSARMTVVQ
jgi:alpha-mannosidase